MEELINQDKIVLTKEEYQALLTPRRIQKKRQNTDVIEGEEWKYIPGTKNLYAQSILGRTKKGYRDTQHQLHDFIMQPRDLNNSLSVGLTITPGNVTYVGVGRLTLMTFKPHQAQEKLYVGYTDGDYKNCRLDNLFWATKKELKEHRDKLGKGRRKLHAKKYITSYGKSRWKMVIFCEADIAEIRRLYNSGINQSEIANQFKTTQSYISQIIRGKVK